MVIALAIMTTAVTTLAQTLDNFNPVINGDVEALAVQPDGKIWVGGLFTTLNSQTCRGLARLTTDGTLDLAFNPGATSQNPAYQPQIISIVVQPDGKIVAGGWFTAFNGISRTNIVRLNLDGTVDLSFNPAYATDIITSMAMQPDGKIIAISGFNVLRINSNGSRDATFNVATSGSIATYLAIQVDGKILIQGGVNLVVSNATYSVNSLGRVNGNGSFDSSFSYFGSVPSNYGVSTSLTIQPDGKVVVGNYIPHYTICGGTGLCIDYFEVRLTRLTSTGSSEADVSFLNRAYNNDGAAKALTIQANGKFLAACDLVRRASADAGLDYNFTNNVSANVMALQSDGKLLVGGSTLKRLINNEPATQTLSYSSNTITWLRGGSTPEVSRTTFEYSTDQGANWANLGPGSRISGGWQLTSGSIPSNAMLRARGFVVAGDSSSWFVESRLQLSPNNPVILVNDGHLGFQSNQFGFNFTADPGLTVVVEGSTNLWDWLPIHTNTMNGNPVWFTDPASSNLVQCFYRLLVKP